MNLDLTAYINSLAKLKLSLSYASSELAKQDPNLFEQFRNSVIQTFEFTYEVAYRMLKRQLASDAAVPALIDTYSFNDLIREGAVKGLIAVPQRWFDYRKLRNITLHTYDQAKAQQVYLAAIEFYQDAEQLLNELKKHNTPNNC